MASYYIMHSYRYKNARTGEDYNSYGFHNGTILGMRSFGAIDTAIVYPNKKAAQQVLRGRVASGVSIISVEDATQLLLNRHHAKATN